MLLEDEVNVFRFLQNMHAVHPGKLPHVLHVLFSYSQSQILPAWKAKEEHVTIALGDLKGMRKRNKGRRFNRKFNSFPYYRISRLVEYKHYGRSSGHKSQ